MPDDTDEKMARAAASFQDKLMKMLHLGVPSGEDILLAYKESFNLGEEGSDEVPDRRA